MICAGVYNEINDVPRADVQAPLNFLPIGLAIGVRLIAALQQHLPYAPAEPSAHDWMGARLLDAVTADKVSCSISLNHWACSQPDMQCMFA